MTEEETKYQIARLLPVLDFTWPQEWQDIWWSAFEFCMRKEAP